MKLNPIYLVIAATLSGCGNDSVDTTIESASIDAFNVVAATPSRSGEYATRQIDYTFEPITVTDTKTGKSYESLVHGYIQYPIDNYDKSPLVVFLHGNHNACEDYLGFEPYSACENPINSYLGFQYISDNLASNGYIVISIDGNAINYHNGSTDLSNAGAEERAHLILHTLSKFKEVDGLGGYDLDNNDLSDLVGKIDFNNLGLMGHSRGGEAVAKATTYNEQLDEPFNIKGVFSLAPTDYNTQVTAKSGLASLAAYCDGDVEDAMGNYIYDASRYVFQDDPYPKYRITPMGANHNYYNTVWTDEVTLWTNPTNDDWRMYRDKNEIDTACAESNPNNIRETAEEQQASGLFLVASYFRFVLGNESQFAPFWQQKATFPNELCPASIGEDCSSHFLLTMQAPSDSRLVIDNTLNESSIFFNSLGGNVTLSGFTDWGTCKAANEGDGCKYAEPTFDTANLLYLKWTNEATYTSSLNDLDITPYHVLTMRVGIAHGDTNNIDGQDFTILLTDTSGNSASVSAKAYSADSLIYPVGSPYNKDAWSDHGSQKTVTQQIVVPLTAFENLDYQHIDDLKLVFDKTEAGTIQMTDLMFQRNDFKGSPE